MANIQNEKRVDKKAQLRREAEERNAAYQKLTPQQRLDKLNAGAWRAKKQRAKLEAELAKEQ